MRRIVKLSLIGLVIGLLGMVYTYSVYGNDITDEIFGEYEVFEKSDQVDAKDINVINIELSGAQLNIEPTEGEQIKVEYEAKIFELTNNDYDLTMDKIGDVLHIELKQNKAMTLTSILNDVDVNVLIPNKQFENISIESNAGKVSINDVQLVKLDIEANVGYVNLNDVAADSIDMEVTVGKVNMNEVVGNFDLTLNAAKMVAKLSEISQNMHFVADAGRFEFILLEEPTNLDVDLNINNGSLKVDLPLDFDEKSKRKVRGSIGQGDHSFFGRIDHGNFKIYVE